MKRKFFSICTDETEGSSSKQDQLFKLEIPLGLVHNELDPAGGALPGKPGVVHSHGGHLDHGALHTHQPLEKTGLGFF